MVKPRTDLNEILLSFAHTYTVSQHSRPLLFYDTFGKHGCHRKVKLVNGTCKYNIPWCRTTKFGMSSYRGQWWAKSNRDSIQSRFESQWRFDSNIARFDSSTMRFDTDSSQILTIRFKSRDTRFEHLNRNLEVMVEILILITHYSVRSYLQMFGFTHHWCMPAIIRSLLLSGGCFERRDQCTYKRCSENGNSNGYHWPEPIKLKYVC